MTIPDRSEEEIRQENEELRQQLVLLGRDPSVFDDLPPDEMNLRLNKAVAFAEDVRESELLGKEPPSPASIRPPRIGFQTSGPKTPGTLLRHSRCRLQKERQWRCCRSYARISANCLDPTAHRCSTEAVGGSHADFVTYAEDCVRSRLIRAHVCQAMMPISRIQSAGRTDRAAPNPKSSYTIAMGAHTAPPSGSPRSKGARARYTKYSKPMRTTFVTTMPPTHSLQVTESPNVLSGCLAVIAPLHLSSTSPALLIMVHSKARSKGSSDS